MRLLARVRLLPALLALPLAAAALLAAPDAAHAATSCAAPGARWTGGSIQGQDGYFINAQIGVQALNSAGQTLTADGCPTSGYTANVWANMDVSGQGTTSPTNHTKSWRVALPANAVSVWIEVYTRTNTPKPCPTCDGPLDTSKYGFVNRRAMPVDQSIPLTAPLHCGITSNGVTGSTGQVVGHFTDAAGDFVTGSVHAWSQAGQNPLPALEGWGQSTEPATGSYVVDALAPNQPYAVWGTAGGVTTRHSGVWVGACRQAVVDFGPGQLGSAVALAAGGPTGLVAAWRTPNGAARVAEVRSGAVTDLIGLGGVVVGAPAVAFTGGTEVVMVRSSNSLVYVQTNSGAGWSGWHSTGIRTLAPPALATAPDGSLWLAAIALNRQIYARHLSGGRWGGWLDLGGASTLAPALAVLPSGTVTLAATSTNREVYAGTLAARWSGWHGLGGLAYAAPAVAVEPGSATPFFVVPSAGHTLWSRTLATGWARTGGASLGAVGLAPAGSSTEIFARGGGNLPYSSSMKGLTAAGFAFAG